MKQIIRLAREETMCDIVEKTNTTVCCDVASNIRFEGWLSAISIPRLGAMQPVRVIIETRTEKKEE